MVPVVMHVQRCRCAAAFDETRSSPADDSTTVIPVCCVAPVQDGERRCSRDRRLMRPVVCTACDTSTHVQNMAEASSSQQLKRAHATTPGASSQLRSRAFRWRLAEASSPPLLLCLWLPLWLTLFELRALLLLLLFAAELPAWRTVLCPTIAVGTAAAQYDHSTSFQRRMTYLIQQHVSRRGRSCSLKPCYQQTMLALADGSHRICGMDLVLWGFD